MDDTNALVWPKKPDQDRIERYNHADTLYSGNHYSAFSIKAGKDFSERYARLRYVVGNFAKIISNVMADMLFGENIVVDAQNDKTQALLNTMIEQNDLLSQLWESAAGNSRRGDSVFKLRIGKRHPRDERTGIIIEEVTPAIYFPVLNRQTAKNVPYQHVIGDVFRTDGLTVLHKEIHEPGYIFHEVYSYDPEKKSIISTLDPTAYNYPVEEKTQVKRALVFHVPNIRDGSGFWGTSDYTADIEPLFFALNNRMSKTDNILDKHSDPILAVPPGVIDENGKINKSALGMFEVDNENPGFNKPEYIVWNANLEAAENQVDKLIEMLYMFSEVAPATMGLDKNGAAESGRALKFRMIATIRKRNRKIRYYDNALRELLLTAQELATANGIGVYGDDGKQLPTGPVEKPVIKWSDRIINDEVEAVEIATQRLDNGTSSRADEIARLDGISPDDARKKVEEIDAESAPKLEAIANNVNGNGTGNSGPGTGNPQNSPQSGA